MSNLLDRAIAVLIPACILLHLALAPYTKVEESFNIQAVHDIATYGLLPSGQTITQNYDHVQFPGSVPRTFVGAYLLALLSSPLMKQGVSPEWDQLIVRAILGSFNALALLSLRRSIRRSQGRITANWFGLLQASQFHVMFYASRTLPNMFAFGLTILALRTYIEAQSSKASQNLSSRNHQVSLVLLTVSGIVFRAEIAVLVAMQSAYVLFINRLSLPKVVIPAGIVGVFIGLALTIPLDSHFWQKFPTWPEYSGFYYNTVLGKASEWGTSPWHFYFTNALPRLLLNPLSLLVLMPLAMSNPATAKLARTIVAPELAFVALYSFLPHKEWRFIVYIVPGLTAVSAMGAAWIWNRRTKSFLYQTLTVALIFSVVGSFTISGGMLAISRLNYPGGQALSQMHAIISQEASSVTVFADNLACQTGVTRFLEAGNATVDGQSKMRLIKSENQTALLDPLFWTQFDYALVEHPEKCIGKWETIDVVTAISGFQLVRPGGRTGPETTTEHLYLDDKKELWQAWNNFGESMRRRVTRGWWISLHMEPKIKILKRQSSSIR